MDVTNGTYTFIALCWMVFGTSDSWELYNICGEQHLNPNPKPEVKPCEIPLFFFEPNKQQRTNGHGQNGCFPTRHSLCSKLGRYLVAFAPLYNFRSPTTSIYHYLMKIEQTEVLFHSMHNIFRHIVCLVKVNVLTPQQHSSVFEL